MGKLFAKDLPVKDIIGKLESFFLVPRYQRNYAWTVDQIEEFWNDLSVGKGPFFAGSIVVNVESKAELDGYAEIIDGP